MEERRFIGLGFGLSATTAWGLFPIYWKQLSTVAPFEALCHKLLWSLGFAAIFITIEGRWFEVKALLGQPRKLLWFLLSGVLIALNGFLFIYAVASGRVIETSLGYFLTPLTSVLLGVVFLQERLRALQRAAVMLALSGVLWLTLRYSHVPWLAMGLCLSFGSYGLVRKVAPAGSLVGYFLETLFISPFATVLILSLLVSNTGSFIQAGARISLLLFFAGLVTIVPRLWFAAAARSISMTTLGILEYATPTIIFFLSTFAYHEPVTPDHLIAFGLVWLGIVIYGIESLTHEKIANQLQAKCRTCIFSPP